MRFALDEAGSFALNAVKPAVSVASVVVIPRDERDSLIAAYQQFKQSLRASELVNGEPKGRKLRPGSRVRFCSLLCNHPRVQICPCIVDLGHFADDTAATLRNGLAADLQAIAERSVDRANLGRTVALIANLNPVQGVRLYTWACSLAWAFRHAILTPDVGRALDEWDDREFLIDPVQTNSRSDEEVVFEEMLPLWLLNWSIVRPFNLLDEVEHPLNSFRHSFILNHRVDFDAVLIGRVRFDRSSSSDDTLQIADIAANILYRAARNLSNDDVAIYERLMQACPYEPDFGIGLITPHQHLAGSSKPNRFKPLVAAMQIAYCTQRRLFTGSN